MKSRSVKEGIAQTAMKSLERIAFEPLELNAAFVEMLSICCELPERRLRNWLKDILPWEGFEVCEDEYQALPQGEDFRLDAHNMIAVRGQPRVCLVAHIDTDREWAQLGGCPTPTVREIEYEGSTRRVLQDRAKQLPIGGDDRAGVAILAYVALHTNLPVGLLFTTDEEVGLRGSRHLPLDWLEPFDLLVQVDRGDVDEQQLVAQIGDVSLCSLGTEKRLLEIARTMGVPRVSVQGMGTDVKALRERGACEAVNLTIGYHRPDYLSGTEFIDLDQLQETLKYVIAIAE